jgi:hypothetical protein
MTDTTYYHALLKEAGGKPIAIGECFGLPNAQTLLNQPRMTFFMCWAYGLEMDYNNNPTNSQDYIREVYANPRVITLDEMPGWAATPTPTPAPTPIPPSGPNLCLGKTALASSVETAGFEAPNAVDGSTLTRWSSAYSDPQWISVDLGAVYTINRVILSWETAYASGYRIEVSRDAANWTSLYGTSTGDGATDDLAVSGTGRYVRMYGTARAASWGYSLWELGVYGTAEPTSTPTPTPSPTDSPTPTATATPWPTNSPTPSPGIPVGKTIWLKSAMNNLFISARIDFANTPLCSTAARADTWEFFDVVDCGGGVIALKARVNGLYASAWTATANAPMQAKAAALNTWEKFTWVDAGGGYIALRALANNLYVSAWSETNNPLYARASVINAWEKFQWGQP